MAAGFHPLPRRWVVERMRFEVYRGHDRDWRWRLRATNGDVVADRAEDYRRREDCERGIAIVKDCADAPVVDLSAKVAEAKPTDAAAPGAAR